MKTGLPLRIACLSAAAVIAGATPLPSDEFATRLFSRLNQPGENLIVSPTSIEAALATVREGAEGKTLEQLNQLLPQNGTAPINGTHVTLESANAIWADQMFPITGTFLTTVNEKYAADIHTADFRQKPDAERRTINRWVENKTHDTIQDLLPAGSVSAMTRMVLVNAIYFKGDWLHAFNPERTVDAPFWISPDESVPVPMMRLSGKRLQTGETETVQTLELPYEGEELSMMLLLPKSRTGQIDDSLDLDTCFDGMRRADVNLFLPRFSIESTFPTLKNTLVALGLTDAFTAQADFSGISEEPLFISDIVHKAFIEVNEKGTEAAAATGITMRTTSIGPPPITFRADHPFLFLIRENASGKILFVGYVANPAATAKP